MTDPTALENLRNGLQILAAARSKLAERGWKDDVRDEVWRDIRAAEARFTAAMNQLQEGPA